MFGKHTDTSNRSARWCRCVVPAEPGLTNLLKWQRNEEIVLPARYLTSTPWVCCRVSDASSVKLNQTLVCGQVEWNVFLDYRHRKTLRASTDHKPDTITSPCVVQPASPLTNGWQITSNTIKACCGKFNRTTRSICPVAALSTSVRVLYRSKGP